MRYKFFVIIEFKKTHLFRSFEAVTEKERHFLASPVCLTVSGIDSPLHNFWVLLWKKKYHELQFLLISIGMR